MSPYSLIILACLFSALPVVRLAIDTHNIARTRAAQVSVSIGIRPGSQAITSKWRSLSTSLRATQMPSRTGSRRQFQP